MKVVIVDGYVDEPGCLGVPPYISPYPRYVAGAIASAGHEYSYYTIDQWRRTPQELYRRFTDANILVLIAGAMVPGKYLRGTPASVRELLQVADAMHHGIKVIGGPLTQFGLTHKLSETLNAKFDYICREDIDAGIYDLLTVNTLMDRMRTGDEWATWSRVGANLVRMHPDYPEPLIVELETYRGCVRYFTGGCSFCIEPEYGEPKFRAVGDIVAEVKALARAGVRNYRLGAQTCIFSYFADGIGETETPKPNPNVLERLLKGIRAVAPNIHVLHVDNANPSVIAAHPSEAYKIAKLLVKYCTGGNVVAFGMESADPVVIKRNNLNTEPEAVMRAIELINAVGAKVSPTGLPYLLPGINFLSGLHGERRETYELNYNFLEAVLNRGLMLRRINLRQVLPVRTEFDTKRYHSEFIKFKSKVRRNIDREMLRRVAPEGRKLTGVYLETQAGNLTYGRQIGAYPLLVVIPYKLQLERFIDVAVISHGYRSLTCIETPLNINKASLRAIACLPGIGMKRAARVIRARPFRREWDFVRAVDERKVAEQCLKYITFKSA